MRVTSGRVGRSLAGERGPVYEAQPGKMDERGQDTAEGDAAPAANAPSRAIRSMSAAWLDPSRTNLRNKATKFRAPRSTSLTCALADSHHELACTHSTSPTRAPTRSLIPASALRSSLRSSRSTSRRTRSSAFVYSSSVEYSGLCGAKGARSAQRESQSAPGDPRLTSAPARPPRCADSPPDPAA